MVVEFQGPKSFQVSYLVADDHTYYYDHPVNHVNPSHDYCDYPDLLDSPNNRLDQSDDNPEYPNAFPVHTTILVIPAILRITQMTMTILTILTIIMTIPDDHMDRIITMSSVWKMRQKVNFCYYFHFQTYSNALNN